MTDLISKYKLLNNSAKQELNDFMDFLLSKQKVEKRSSLSKYKRKILSVSSWSDSDLMIFEKNQSLFNQWNVEEW
jgi:hypothetical protein